MGPLINSARERFHQGVSEEIIRIDSDGVPNFADKSNRASATIAKGVLANLPYSPNFLNDKLAGQTLGHAFERACRTYIDATLPNLGHLRPGRWQIIWLAGRQGMVIADYEQYNHLHQLQELAAENKSLKSVLGNDYTIAPDIVVAREPEPDETINADALVVGDSYCKLASLRQANNPLPILHASISCKWTIRSDRSQNARSEALNLLRNRKGRAPHICVVTAEPLPSRLASIALGTGDLDCVYHFALPELVKSVEEFGECEAASMLDILIDGKRLRDISDLPLDLAT